MHCKYTINWLQTLAGSNPLYKHQQHFAGHKGVLHSGDSVIQQSAVTIILAILVQCTVLQNLVSSLVIWISVLLVGWLIFKWIGKERKGTCLYIYVFTCRGTLSSWQVVQFTCLQARSLENGSSRLFPCLPFYKNKIIVFALLVF